MRCASTVAPASKRTVWLPSASETVDVSTHGPAIFRTTTVWAPEPNAAERAPVASPAAQPGAQRSACTTPPTIGHGGAGGAATAPARLSSSAAPHPIVAGTAARGPRRGGGPSGG